MQNIPQGRQARTDEAARSSGENEVTGSSWSDGLRFRVLLTRLAEDFLNFPAKEFPGLPPAPGEEFPEPRERSSSAPPCRISSFGRSVALPRDHCAAGVLPRFPCGFSPPRPGCPRVEPSTARPPARWSPRHSPRLSRSAANPFPPEGDVFEAFRSGEAFERLFLEAIRREDRPHVNGPGGFAALDFGHAIDDLERFLGAIVFHERHGVGHARRRLHVGPRGFVGVLRDIQNLELVGLAQENGRDHPLRGNIPIEGIHSFQPRKRLVITARFPVIFSCWARSSQTAACMGAASASAFSASPVARVHP